MGASFRATERGVLSGPDAVGAPGAWRAVEAWFAAQGWEAFEFQREAWRAYLRGESGLIHAPTGVGKTLAAWMGPVLEWLGERADDGLEPARGAQRERERAEPLRVVWVTPMRALASDTVLSLLEVVEGLGLPWTVEKRTGDTAGSLKKKQRVQLPTCLVTTPESLSLLLSYPECRERFATLRCIVADEWHELMGTKRGVQTELCLARLRAFAPGVRTWGVSATLGNLDEAAKVLLGPDGSPTMVRGMMPKDVEIRTLIPDEIERFPWAGHLGLRVLPQVLEVVEKGPHGQRAKGQMEEGKREENGEGGATLIFTNTRSQAEIWFKRILDERPDLLGQVAIHHGSLDRSLRAEVEGLLSDARLRCVVCTSSLDLGVDFSPVERVVQLGSPKGVARLLQRAGRSGHRPGAASRVYGAPTNALELVEFAAARDAARRGEIEGRRPLERALDVLVQHLVTVAAGGGFVEEELKREVRGTWAFRNLSDREWAWCMDFVHRGGESLRVYPQYARIRRVGRDEGTEARRHEEEEAWGEGPNRYEPGKADGSPGPLVKAAEGDGQSGEPVRWVVASDAIARVHRLGIGTITSEMVMQVKLVRGARTTGGTTLGTIEEGFISRLAVGDRFVFTGRVLELVKVRGMTVYARKARQMSGIVPRWDGGRFPLSTQMAAALRRKLDEARRGVYADPEMAAVRPVLELQRAWSVIPAPDELLVEVVTTQEGFHIFVFPLDGRSVHEGLGALAAYRLTRGRPLSVTASANDYGLELLSPEELPSDEASLRALLSPEGLVEDLLGSLNSTQMARRQFRDIARIAGLIIPAYPGTARPQRYVQASSDMFFDVFEQFDPGNMLLDQARREVLEAQLEVSRLRATMERLAGMRMTIKRLDRLTPLAFPLWAEQLRSVHASSEPWSEKIAKMVVRLEAEADEQAAGRGKPARGRGAKDGGRGRGSAGAAPAARRSTRAR